MWPAGWHIKHWALPYRRSWNIAQLLSNIPKMRSLSLSLSPPLSLSLSLSLSRSHSLSLSLTHTHTHTHTQTHCHSRRPTAARAGGRGAWRWQHSTRIAQPASRNGACNVGFRGAPAHAAIDGRLSGKGEALKRACFGGFLSRCWNSVPA